MRPAIIRLRQRIVLVLVFLVVIGIQIQRSRLLQKSILQDDATFPYRIKANTQVSDLAIGVISGSGEKQRRRIALQQETWIYSLNSTKDSVLIFSDSTDPSIPTIGLVGTGSTWTGAQDRFFPVLAHLHTAFPNAEWYMLVDDDTFLVPHTLKEMLEKHKNARSTPWYVGRAMYSLFKRDKEEKEILVSFAHGGSGICLSAGLMTAFRPHLLAALRDKEKSHCQGMEFGDGNLGLCIKLSLDLDVTHEACLHSMGPLAYKGMADARIDKPCSFHHAFKTDDMLRYGAEKDKNDDANDDQIRRWHREYNVKM